MTYRVRKSEWYAAGGFTNPRCFRRYTPKGFIYFIH